MRNSNSFRNGGRLLDSHQIVGTLIMDPYNFYRSIDRMIVHIIRFFYPHLGGNENQAYRLLNKLKDISGQEYKVYTYRYSTTLQKKDNINGIDVERLSLFCNILEIIRSLRKRLKNSFLRRIISKIIFYIEEFDIYVSLYYHIKKNRHFISLLHVHQLTTISLVASNIKKKYNIPFLAKDATTDGLSFFDIMPLGSIARNQIVSNGVFISMTEIIKHYLISRGVDDNQIYNIPNGIDVPKEYKKQHYTHNGKILFVGNYDQGAIKGLDLLVNAFIYLRRKECNCKLIIVGRGPRENYIKLLKAANIDSQEYTFIGPSEDVISYFSESNVYVLPSRVEGFSNSLLEALLWGMPCVSTDISSARELIVDKFNGRIAEVDNYISLAECIQYCLNNKNIEDWPLNSYMRIKEKFSLDVVAKSYIELYQKIILK